MLRYYRLKDTPFLCSGTGKLRVVGIAMSIGRLPLTPEKRVGYRVER